MAGIEYFLDRNLAHVGSTLRQHLNQVFLTELDKCLPYRLPADGKPLAHLDFGDGLAGQQLSTDDGRTQDAVQLRPN